uniref:Conserved pT26-2 family protein n=1 Tax=Pyrococcus abyssi TaxID=29292 RepID=A0A5J6XUR4_PYRAY|nr:hypothetical protein [Pyrococcus abyssi]QFN51300.1 conserved pT26-2 family protein [Pyrococcus abyssi]
MGEKGLKFGQWLLKTSLASGLLGALLWYGSQHSITVAQVNEAVASLPLVFVVLIEVFDKIADKNDYYNKLYTYAIGKQKSRIGAVLISLIFAGLGMFVVIWALTGTITMNIKAYTPAVFFTAGLISLYIFAPETGDDELLLWWWIGATIATHGQYITILPNFTFG